MIRKTKILIGILLLVILVAVCFLTWQIVKIGEVAIITEKTEYESEEVLKLKIKNNLEKNICFSSCYPYYLEKRNGEWKSYSYGTCQKPDLNETCIDPGQSKAFEINLFLVEEGLHRIALPACINCEIGEEFRESKRFYSNEFIIK